MVTPDCAVGLLCGVLVRSGGSVRGFAVFLPVRAFPENPPWQVLSGSDRILVFATGSGKRCGCALVSCLSPPVACRATEPSLSDRVCAPRGEAHLRTDRLEAASEANPVIVLRVLGGAARRSPAASLRKARGAGAMGHYPAVGRRVDGSQCRPRLTEADPECRPPLYVSLGS